jgi:hypothetical protein
MQNRRHVSWVRLKLLILAVRMLELSQSKI